MSIKRSRRLLVILLPVFFLLSASLIVGASPSGWGFSKYFTPPTFVKTCCTPAMGLNDTDISVNGKFFAAVNNTGLYFYSTNTQQPKIPIWWFLTSGTPKLMSVAMSSDGTYVVAGGDNGMLYYFNNGLTRIGNQLTPTWVSKALGGPITKSDLDMSDNGVVVVAGGSGQTFYYYGGSTTRTGTGQIRTWSMGFPSNSSITLNVATIDLTPDGLYAAVGGSNYVAFLSNATESIKWIATTSIHGAITDISISDDANAVAAVDNSATTLYYWNNAKTLSGDPTPTWVSNQPFSAVDISGDGNGVVAGKPIAPSGGISYWGSARFLTGTPPPNWTVHGGEGVFDVEINTPGNIIAATTVNATGAYKLYFLMYDTGNPIGDPTNFVLLNATLPLYLSMSGDGLTTVEGGSPTGICVYTLSAPVVGGTLSLITNPVVSTTLLVGVSVALSVGVGYAFAKKK